MAERHICQPQVKALVEAPFLGVLGMHMRNKVHAKFRHETTMVELQTSGFRY